MNLTDVTREELADEWLRRRNKRPDAAAELDRHRLQLKSMWRDIMILEPMFLAARDNNDPRIKQKFTGDSSKVCLIISLWSWLLYVVILCGV